MALSVRKQLISACVLAAFAVNQAASEPMSLSIAAAVTKDLASLDGSISRASQIGFGNLGASLTLHDNSAQGLDHADLTLSYSAPLHRSEVGLASAKFQYAGDLFFRESISSESYVATLNYARVAFGNVMTNTSIMHSLRRGLQGSKHSTSVFSFSGLRGIGKTTLSTKFSLGVNEDEGGDIDHFNGVDLSVSRPVMQNINLSINASWKPDHFRKFHDGQAYDIWAEQKSISLAVSFAAPASTVISFNVTHSDTQTDYFSQRFSQSKTDWVVSAVKRF